MKIFFLFMTVLFLVFASLQLNDPDPIIWILIYGSMAAVSVMAAFRFYIRWLMVGQLVGYVIYCVILFPGFMTWLRSEDRSLLFDDLAKMQYLFIEEAREFMGLLICIATLGIIWLAARLKA